MVAQTRALSAQASQSTPSERHVQPVLHGTALSRRAEPHGLRVRRQQVVHAAAPSLKTRSSWYLSAKACPHLQTRVSSHASRPRRFPGPAMVSNWVSAAVISTGKHGPKDLLLLDANLVHAVR